MTQSPMYLSIVPWLLAMMAAMRLNRRLSRACTCCGAMFSASRVNCWISQNMMLSSRDCTAVVYASGRLTISLTNAAGT